MNRRPTGAKKVPRGVFVATTVVIFFCALSVADSVGFVPYYVDGTAPSYSGEVALSDLPELGKEAFAESLNTQSSTRGQSAFPVRIAISSIDIDLSVQNPATTDIAALDALLSKGPVRYSASAKLGEKGNVLIFAHSSHLPVVHNKMYQAFNAIPEAKRGDTISLTGSDGVEYLYVVTAVVQANVNDGTTIDLSKDGAARLTLVTCDTLTAKSARHVLTADFVGTN